MTQKANPSINRPAEAYKTAGAIAYGGHGGSGFIVDGATPTDISTQDAGITESNLAAFSLNGQYSSSSFDVTVDPGEAFVFGSWIAIDTQTTVTLSSDTNGQTVYAGWNKSGPDDVIVGLDSAFSNAGGDTDEKIPLYTFDTDTNGVSSVTDERDVGQAPNIERDVDFDTNKGINAGHDEVDVPQVVNRTVEDWESGTLDTDVWTGDTGNATVQSSFTIDGDYTLELKPSIGGAPRKITSYSGLGSYPQQGDTFTQKLYLNDSGDSPQINFGVQGDSSYYIILIQASSGDFALRKMEPSGATELDRPSPGIPVDEVLTVTVDWGLDGEIDVTLKDSNGSVVETLNATDETYTHGGVSYLQNYPDTDSPVYFDSLTLQRREPEDRRSTKKGTTDLGNEVVPSGSIQTGPTTANTNAERAVYQDAPVDSNATQGTESILTLLQSGVIPSAMVRRTLDGQGGAYGHQLDAPLGRFARINANLSWEYNSLTEVPNWYSQENGGSVYTFNINGRSRRIHAEHDGSGSSTGQGGIKSTALTTFGSIGSFRVTWHEVSYTNTDEPYHMRLGLTDQPADANLKSTGNSFYIRGSSSAVVDSGTDNFKGLSIDWTQNHDITMEYDGSEVRFYVDGVLKNTHSYSANADFAPIIQARESSTANSTEIVEAGQITVEPLPEVLQ